MFRDTLLFGGIWVADPPHQGSATFTIKRAPHLPERQNLFKPYNINFSLQIKHTSEPAANQSAHALSNSLFSSKPFFGI